jgi:hypothetical protein
LIKNPANLFRPISVRVIPKDPADDNGTASNPSLENGHLSAGVPLRFGDESYAKYLQQQDESRATNDTVSFPDSILAKYLIYLGDSLFIAQHIIVLSRRIQRLMARKMYAY